MAQPIQIVTQEACGRCKFAVREDENFLRCRRMPPTVGFFIIGRNDDGTPKVMQYQHWPIVVNDESCGEWKPRILT